MKRNEHLKWAKDRAIKHLEIDEVMHAWMSFLSDMRKHDELKDHVALELGTMLMMSGGMDSKKECEKFINGFN